MLVAFGATPNVDLQTAMAVGGWVNVPAVIVVGFVTWLLIIGTTESARVNAVLVLVKIAALTAFVALTIPVAKATNFDPFLPTGGVGVFGAAASIFFAYVGFDAVSTAAEETKNPQRNVPIGLIGSLVICTIFYLLVASGAIGAIGAQPVMTAGQVLAPGSAEMAGRCASIVASGAIEPLVCSKEALVHVLDTIGWPAIGRLVGLAAVLALPSVVLMMMFGQTRIFFTMARDGLLPRSLATLSPRTGAPVRITLLTGVSIALVAGLFRLDEIAELANAGTLLAFIAVAACMMVLRRRAAGAKRLFRCPAPFAVGTLAVLGCLYLLWSLPQATLVRFLGWNAIGLAAYLVYGRRHGLAARR
jgi:APA family basic amino acid/polyamine antiporter